MATAKLRVALLAAIVAVAAGSRADAHETADDHQRQDAVTHTPSEQRALERRTEALTDADADRAAARAVGTPDQVGSWGPVLDWPLVGIHVALLEDGRVLAYDSVRDAPVESHTDHNTTRAIVWNPATGGWTRADVDTGFNLFCSGAAHLPDGSVFLAGGNKNAAADGIDRTHVFEHAPPDWSLGERMATERWYPSVTPLANGETLITEGGPTAPDIPEIRGVDGRIRQLAGAAMNLAEYPWVDVAPGGWAFVSGPDLTMHAIDPSGSGSLRPLGRRDDVYRDYGSRAMYDVGKVLVTGGGPASDDAEVIDLNINPALGQRPRVSQTEPMEHGRRQHNLTVLADGSVLATGGISNGTPRVDLEHGVYDAELWDPGTGAWSTLAPMAVTRQYHSTALLLPDGRVLSSGGGICGDCVNAGYLAKNAEVFSPPYLFESDGSGDLAARPRITSAPAGVGFGRAFRVASPDVAEIEELALVRLGSVTHSVNMEQRYVPLDFVRRGGELEAVSPGSGSIAPPGPYMLFAIDRDGVPSVARMVRVGASAPPPPAAPRDTVAPETTIDRGPPRRSPRRRVRFAFSADEPGSSFECRYDSNPFTPCSSPARARLGRKIHRFVVRATDPSGNTDLDPATARFRIARR